MRFSELQLSEARLDQPPCNNQPKKLVIVSSPRSGSFMLCRYLVNCGLGVPHEYFNDIHAKIIGPRLGVVELARCNLAEISEAALHQYIAAIKSRRTKNGVFAVKIQYWQLDRLASHGLADELFADSVVVHLYRRNVLDQSLSLHFARVTGRWGAPDEAPTTASQDPSGIFDRKLIDLAMDNILAEDLNWRKFLAHRDLKHMDLVYERFCADPRAFCLEIADALKVRGDSLDTSYSELGGSIASPSDKALREQVRREYLKK
ncbi:MAG: Stf0 family sulfotransferase [Alphaproteobacteria bacterium]|nr:Stf0 family sulfotransferase [Alphaproteobacteria bacterium]